ncbi:CPBP family glutamic-type intramembrane protease [Belliella aquatica]|uniref:CPBP family glutamic-type intramembrane protease n=1 Tax=Belliella aquatica TaxID=1323734 RepID=UPI003570CB3F
MHAFFLKFLFVFFIILIQNLLFNSRINTQNSVFDGENIYKIFLNVVILAPLIEEFVFRYHLRLKFKNVVFSAIASIVLFHDSFLKLSLILLYFLTIFVFLKSDIEVKRLILVFVSSFMFAVLHLDFAESYISFEYSIFVFLPHFFGALVYCYVFFKKGIFVSIMLHIIWNLVGFLSFLLKTKLLEF